MPKRFSLTYTDETGNLAEPVVVHRSSIGAIERLMAFLIEHYAGKFPVWLAPEQIRIITVNQTEAITAIAENIAEQAKELDLRVYVDNANESVGKKIRESEKMKVPYAIVIGEKEAETGEVTPRIRGDIIVQKETPIKIENFLKTVSNEARARTTKTTL
jgi:threonyl-tRNA synthetase